MRRFPPLSDTFQNILTSLCAIGIAILSLLSTILCILPLSIFRAFVPKENLSLSVTATDEARIFFGRHDERKIVLIVGASCSVGFELLKLYAVEDDTRIIAVSPGSDLPALCAKVSDLGDYAKALFRFEPLDFGNSDGMAEAVKFLDEDFGPVSHLFVVCGIPAHLKEHPDAWKLDPTIEMVQRNIIGTAATVLPMIECMGARRYGKIAVVSSGYCTPVNMLSHVGVRAFLDTYLPYLHVLGNIVNVDVVNISVEHDFADGLLDNGLSSGTEKGEGEGRVTNGLGTEREREMLGELARKIKEGVEGGGIATIGWPARKHMMKTAARAVNPCIQQFQMWAQARHKNSK